jgi:hypothetical protein
MSHNLTSASVVDVGVRALRKRQVDVGNSVLEGFKELFQVFSLTQRHVTPDGNCMPLSEAERTLWKDISGDNKYKEISKAQREVRTKEIRQGAVAYVESVRCESGRSMSATVCSRGSKICFRCSHHSNTTACDTRWKLYAVVNGRKNTVEGYVQ